MLAAGSHSEASAVREGIDGKRCSRQEFEIFRKIAEVDALITPALQARVFEGHPEVTFAFMRGGDPMDDSKKTTAGRSARLTALRKFFPQIDDIAAARRTTGVGRDDVLDAYAMLWTARRIAAGDAVRLQEEPQRDERGLRAEMLA
jgi:predicted RNase H-like nuclease